MRELKRRGLLSMAVFFALGCSTPIHHGLDETAANEVLTSLERAGIGASKARDEDGSFVVSVGRADVVRALEFMRASGLPRERRVGFGEIYKQPSLVPTATEERARYLEAITGEIARTLESVEGVASARVHLVLAEPDPLGQSDQPRVPAQAAVLLKTRSREPPPIAEAEVQKLVAGSVPGLERTAVAVVFTSAPELPTAHGAGLVALGPLRLTQASRSALVFVALGGCVLVAILALLLLVTARRLAAAQRKR
jgi:type III secretion protein J